MNSDDLPTVSDCRVADAQFVNLRVLRLAQDDPLVWQRALLKGEVRCCQCVDPMCSCILCVCQAGALLCSYIHATTGGMAEY